MKIMFYANDPGGANAIKPLLNPLEGENDIFIYGNNSALKILPNCKEYNKNLQKIMPDIVITGTSANEFTEKIIWKESKKLDIKTIAILDHWCNYGVRFSKYGLNEIEKFDKKCDFLPDYIIVMDNFAKQEMIKDGVPQNIIYPLGNPHFEEIYNNSKNVKLDRKIFASNDQKIITFASEPTSEDYGQGFELDAVADLIDICKNKNVKIIIRPHPRETENKYKKFLSDNVEVSKNYSSQEIINISDIVISMTSMFLIEAIIMKKPIISYQLNETNKENFILTKKHTIPFINNKKSLKLEFEKILTSNKKFVYNDTINYNTIEDICNFIKREIWQN